MLRGFDVSHHNGSIDWAALRDRYEIRFGAAKATEGVNFTDDQFPANWQKLADAGLVRMAYHYAHPANDPLDEADHFIGYAILPAPKLDTDLYVLDLETGDGLGQATVNAWAKAWARRVTDLTGRRPVLYTGHVYMENQTGVGLNGPFSAWWYPRYPDKYANQSTWPTVFDPVLPSPNAWGGPPQFWQFSQSFPTAYGDTDANVFDGTLDQLQVINGGDVELTDRISLLKADGTRNWPGTILGLDSITVGAALAYGAASLSDGRKTVLPAIEEIKGALFKLDGAALAAIAEAVNNEIATRQQA